MPKNQSTLGDGIDMTIQEMEQIAGSRPTEWPDGEALHAGLTVILTDVAASHLRAGDMERATLCVVEAERCLSYVRLRKSMDHRQ